MQLTMLIPAITGQKWEVTYEPVSRLEKKDVVVFEQPEGSYDFGGEASRRDG